MTPFFLEETEFHSVNKHRKIRLFPEANTVCKTFTSVNKAIYLQLELPVTSSSPLSFSSQSHILSSDVLLFLAHGKMNILTYQHSCSRLRCRGRYSTVLIRQGQRSTPLTSAVSNVMVNSLSVCRIREREWTAARSRSRAPSS